MTYEAGSMGIRIQKIVDVLETEGEMEWASKIDEAYYSNFGIGAARAALLRLRELQRDDDVLDRLDIRESVRDLVMVLSLAAGEDETVPTMPNTPSVARQLLQSISKEDEPVRPLGSAAAGAQRLLDTLRDERR